MGGDEKTTNTSQSSQTNPYAPTEPMLSNIISSLGSVGTGVTPGQTAATNNLQNAAAGLPDFSTGVTGAVNNALGTNTTGAQGMLTNALGTYNKNLGSTADGSELNPYSTPGFSDALGTMTNDITNAVKGTFAGSGRDPSGAGSFAGSLGRGLTQGEAPVIQAQYNQNKTNQMNAATDLFGGAGSTASGLTQQQLEQLQGQFQGVQGAGAAPGILTGNAQTQLGAANTAYNQPYQNIGSAESLLNPIAALGGQSTGTGTSTSTTTPSLLSNIIGGASGLAGLNGAMGGGWLSSLGSSLGGGLSSLLAFSDERVKEDIAPVGETHEGQTLYSYRYIGDPEPRVGLLAQEEERRDPDNVVEIGGIKAVNYERALAGSRKIGLLKMAA
jgi:hypothetical protein